jgi:hypothetical protein
MVRSAVPVAIALAAHLQLPSLAATLIGTAYRMPPDLAIRAFVDGIAAASKHSIHVRWSLPEPIYREVARTEASVSASGSDPSDRTWSPLVQSLHAANGTASPAVPGPGATRVDALRQ